ncbi:MAG: hypothetical protein HOE48_18380 [Candidatus Latescibacteria bacterium]|nr:hypothetical protein [Candidatus Latescibacterota bacterium]MBT4139890.1 hypothetical protein [Candidatus Latescibacterota bacterium]MBT5832794.1 hypothetical protein [Candidatus Latescibacterota bacterium]
MAWLYQRGKKWWIGYYDEKGKRVRRSIGDSREVAEVALGRVEAEMKKNNPDYSMFDSEDTGDANGMDLHLSKQRLTTYPAVRSVVNVRELFARIYEQLGFEVLKSQEDFPHYVLAIDGKPICAHVVVRSRDFLALNLDPQVCDRIICWIDDWRDAPIPTLELSQYYDFY